MIFLDESGKRWRAIKRVTKTGAAGLLVPILLVGTGAFLFNPGWASLALKPLQKPAVLGAKTTAAQATVATAAIKARSPTKSSTVNNAQTTGGVQLAASLPTNSTTLEQPAYSSPITPSSTTSTPTTTPPQASTPPSDPHAKSKTVDPGKSSQGLAHHFTPL